MVRRFVAAALLVIYSALPCAALEAEEVQFQSTGKAVCGKEVMLSATLIRPQGTGPFPAVVLLHTSYGLGLYEDIWARRLSDWGYVTLQVDSFEPRGVANTVMDRDLVPGSVRAQDAYDAKSYLGKLPFVDERRMALMGWSHGGWATLYAVFARNRSDPFTAAITFYTICDVPSDDTNSPLLIIAGEMDPNMPEDCILLKPAFRKRHPEVSLKLYPGEGHFFDWYDTKAATDAVIQVKKFLEKYLKWQDQRNGD